MHPLENRSMFQAPCSAGWQPAADWQSANSRKALLLFLIACAPIIAQTTAFSPAQVDTVFPASQALYMDLHANPELAFQETQTAAKLAARMKALGYDVTTGVGKTGLVCLLKNGPGPTVMFRTELDALPVDEKTGLPFASKTPHVMHACGHDLHMAAWIGTARLMAENKDAWRGTLMMIGQPAEEGGAGAKAMLADGLFTRFPKPDFALSLHDDDTMPSGQIGYHPGPFRAMSDGVTITLYGRGGHAAMPMNTIDPVVMAARAVLALQTIVSRENNPVDPVVVTVGSIHGGTAGNVIPDEVTLQLSVRTYTQEVRKRVMAAIERITKAEAQAAGATREPKIEIRGASANVVYNDPALTARLAAALKKAMGDANVVEMPPKMTSEDFAEYGIAGVPSALLQIGAVPPAKLAEAKRTGIAVPAPHSPEWVPELEPTLKAAIRAETTELLDLFRTQQ